MSHLSYPPDRPDQALAERPAECACRVVHWLPFDGSGSLLGKATVAFRNGLIVSNIPVFKRNDGTLSVGTPDAPLVDANGQQLRDADGKRRYTKIVSFATQEARERWNGAILAALSDAGIAGAAS